LNTRKEIKNFHLSNRIQTIQQQNFCTIKKEMNNIRAITTFMSVSTKED